MEVALLPGEGEVDRQRRKGVDDREERREGGEGEGEGGWHQGVTEAEVSIACPCPVNGGIGYLEFGCARKSLAKEDVMNR